VEESHLPIIHTLYTAAYTDGLWPTNPTLESLTRRIHSALLTLTLTLAPPTTAPPLPTPQQPAIPAVIGFLLLTGSPSDPLLEDLIVHSAHRRGGYGALLVGAMKDAVSTGGIPGSAAAARVDCYCQWGVKGFYERCGFVMVRGEQGGRCLMRWAVPGR